LIKALSNFCEISVNILNCHDFFPLYFYSKIGSILYNVIVNCSASGRFFPFVGLVVWAFEDEK